MIQKYSFTKLAAIFILSAAIIFSYSLVRAQSQTDASATVSGTQGIVFPIPELGNCSNKDACRAYCNDPANMDACIAFAKSHGLMNKNEADQAENFKAKLAAGSGPGGCKSPDECNMYCSNVQNIDACLKFAEDHGFRGDKIDKAKKMQALLKGGGQTPGGCKSEAECKTYCSDFAHADECRAFAKKIGMGTGEGNPGNLSADQFQKFTDLVKNGQTPGGCTSKDACESYCSSADHRAECVAFGEKLGFISSDQGQKILSGTVAGPGGCNSEESCKTYCNGDAHHDECFKFAEDQGLLDKGEIQDAQNGLVRMRAGFSDAPPEVQACLNSKLGTSTIDDIQSGNLTPSPEIGGEVRDCFEQFGEKADSGEVFKNAPPEVLSCLKSKFGEQFSDLKSGKIMPTSQMADTFRVCFESLRGGEGSSTAPSLGMPSMIEHAQQFLNSAPPEVVSCVKEKLGSDFAKLQSGDTELGSDVYEKMKNCFAQFRPNDAPTSPFRRPGGAKPQMFNSGFQGIPQAVADCLKATIGSDATAKVEGGDTGGLSDAAKTCFEKMKNSFQGGMMQSSSRTDGDASDSMHMPPPQSGGMMQPSENQDGSMPRGNFTAPPQGGDQLPQGDMPGPGDENNDYVPPGS